MQLDINGGGMIAGGEMSSVLHRYNNKFVESPYKLQIEKYSVESCTKIINCISVDGNNDFSSENFQQTRFKNFEARQPNLGVLLMLSHS